MTDMGRILVIDDDKDMCTLVQDMLEPRSFEVVIGDYRKDVVRQVDEAQADVLLTDMRMPQVDGLSLCRRLADARPDVHVVVMTGFGSLETAIDAIRVGAYDFVTKPVDADALSVVLARAVKNRRLGLEVRRLRSEGTRAGDGAATILGDSDVIRKVRELVRQVADLDVTVLITGESGTGKEVVARSLHMESSRRSGPFVAINCAAVPESLLESQLFGHVRGAFTDARTDRIGLFAQASGGTLFLDEIGELPLALQPKLLRALQERVVRPVGGAREVPFDARVVVATNRRLEELVADGRFREDLFYRINVVRADVPPLRTRGEDVLQLAQHFIEKTALRMKRPVRGISASAAAALLGHDWPGNVRELQNAMERAVALTQYEEIVADDLPRRAARASPPSVREAAELIPLEEVERRHVLAVLAAVNNSRKRASTVLGVDPKTLYRKLLQWGVTTERAADKAS